MQKVIIVKIDIEQLKQSSGEPFSLVDIDEVNTLLEEGWVIEDREFITSTRESEKALLMLVLNDGAPDYSDALFELDEDENDTDEQAAEKELSNVRVTAS
jgi:hypothetical protein